MKPDFAITIWPPVIRFGKGVALRQVDFSGELPQLVQPVLDVLKIPA